MTRFPSVLGTIMLTFFLGACAQHTSITKTADSSSIAPAVTTNLPAEVETIPTSETQIMNITSDTPNKPSDKIIVTQPPTEPQCTLFDDFSVPKKRAWVSVNDNVMGGRSFGDFDIKDETLTLKGTINLNGGGFTSIRVPLEPNALTDFTTVELRVKTDGRGYALTFRDTNRGGRLSHRLPLSLNASDDWQTVKINLNDLKPAFFGQYVNAKAFDKTKAREMGFILNDGLGGPYKLEIQTIKFCTDVT